jgi:hypothetical protein
MASLDFSPASALLPARWRQRSGPGVALSPPGGEPMSCLTAAGPVERATPEAGSSRAQLGSSFGKSQ